MQNTCLIRYAATLRSVNVCEVCVNKRLKFEDSSLSKDDSIEIWHEWDTVSETYEKNGEEKSAKVTRKCVRRGPLKQPKTSVCECVREQLAKHVYGVNLERIEP